MTEQAKKITLGFIISWLFGLLLLLAGLGSFISADYATGTLALLVAFIALPPANELLKNKLKFTLSGGAKFVLIVVLLIMMGALMPSQNKTTPTPNDNSQPHKSLNQVPVQPTTPVAEKLQEQAPASKSYQEVFTFSGNGTKKSEPFTITGDRFKIAYDCKGSYCGAQIYAVGSDFMKDIIMNVTGSTKDETILYGAGEYYIDAGTMGNYTMTVYDYR